MSAEAQRPTGEQQSVDPIQAARGSFNQALFGAEYNGGALVARTVRLQNVLLGSPLSPERVFHELTLVAGQAAVRAEMQQDSDIATTLREMQAGFQLTYDNFRQQAQQTEVASAPAPRPAEATRTESLPPMTGAKGEQSRRTQQKTIQAQPEAQAQTTSTDPATLTPDQPATVDTQPSTPEPQTPPKRRGRPPINPQ